MISRWYSNLAQTCDIIKTGCQVKIILNIIFGKLFEPTDTLILGWIFGVGTSVSDFSRPSYKTACDIHLKHVFLTELGLWRNPAPKLFHIPFRFFGYHKLARTVVISIYLQLGDIWVMLRISQINFSKISNHLTNSLIFCINF